MLTSGQTTIFLFLCQFLSLAAVEEITSAASIHTFTLHRAAEEEATIEDGVPAGRARTPMAYMHVHA